MTAPVTDVPFGYRGKRFLDLAVSGILLVLLSPLLAVVAVGVRLTMGRPVLFRQSREGWNQIPFQIVKFRTMHDTRGEAGNLLADTDRLSAFGRFLRKTSLDELPELLNVVRGEMSLVEPRPLFVWYGPAYSPPELKRFRVRPGITGLAQVSGRNLVPWDERLALDVRYVENMSLGQDVRILVRTITAAARTVGVSVDPDLVEKDLAEERLGTRSD